MTRKATTPRNPAAAQAETAEPRIGTGIAALMYFGLAILYFLPALLPFRHIYGSDYLAGGYFFYEFVSERLAAGDLPKWVPYLYGGLPLFSNPGSTFYPVRLLADLVLPPDRLLATIFVVQFAAAGLGSYLLSRELGVRSWIAFVVGLAFQFTGLTMSYVLAGHDGRIIAVTLTPLFLYFLHRGIRTGGLAAFAGAAATLGVSLLSFQIQSNYYMLLAGALWALFSLWALGTLRAPGALARRVALGLAAVAFGFVLAAVNFLPFLDYVDASPRGSEEGRGYEWATGWSMSPPEVIGLAVPEFYGVSVPNEQGEFSLGSYRGENPFRLHTEYVGALVVALLALGAYYSRRNRYWWFFAGLSIFALTIAFGRHTPLYRLYYAVLPGTKMFRTPDIAFFLAVVSLNAMAAITLERLAALRDEWAASRRTARAGDEARPTSWILGGLVALFAFMILVVGATAGEAARTTGVLRFTFFLLLVAGTLWFWLRRGLGARTALVALSIVTVVDLWIVDRHFFRTVPPPEATFAADDVVRFLQAQPGPYRVWTLPAGAVYRGQVDDYLMHFDIEQAGGEHGNQLQRYNQYAGAGEEVYVDWHNFLQFPQFMAAANVRYIIAGQPVGLEEAGFREAYRGSAVVYENPAALPRAYLVPEVVVAQEPTGALDVMRSADWNPARTAVVYDALGEPLPDTPLEGGARVVAYAPDEVVVETQANRPALLVLADNYYEGWAATVDGADTPIHLTNHTFRGVRVPAGSHTVTFRFEAPDLMTGFVIYLVGWGLLLAYGLFLFVRRRRGAGGTAGEA